jgi:hypothetical protein
VEDLSRRGGIFEPPVVDMEDQSGTIVPVDEREIVFSLPIEGDLLFLKGGI